MSDTSDDMEAWSSLIDDRTDYTQSRTQYFLEKIAYCELKDFNDQNHMVNYMKKIARLALEGIHEGID
jgi:hypothetical protein